MRIAMETIFAAVLAAVLLWLSLFMVFTVNGEPVASAASSAITVGAGGAGLAWTLWVVMAITISIVTRKQEVSKMRTVVIAVLPVVLGALNVALYAFLAAQSGAGGMMDLVVVIAVLVSTAFAGSAAIAVALTRVVFRWLNARG